MSAVPLPVPKRASRPLAPPMTIATPSTMLRTGTSTADGATVTGYGLGMVTGAVPVGVADLGVAVMMRVLGRVTGTAARVDDAAGRAGHEE